MVVERVNELLLCHMGLSMSSDVWSLVEGRVKGALDLCFSTGLSLFLMSCNSSDRASGERGCSGERREEGTPLVKLGFKSKASSARMALLHRESEPPKSLGTTSLIPRFFVGGKKKMITMAPTKSLGTRLGYNRPAEVLFNIMQSHTPLTWTLASHDLP